MEYNFTLIKMREILCILYNVAMEKINLAADKMERQKFKCEEVINNAKLVGLVYVDK